MTNKKYVASFEENIQKRKTEIRKKREKTASRHFFAREPFAQSEERHFH